MSNIEKFQSAFVVNFPVEIADQVLARIQMLYGEAFDKKYGEVDAAQLQLTACTVLNGLSESELRRGLERMNSEKWCPSLPEFRSWCVQDPNWWTAEQAWAKSLNFLNDDSEKITTLAKRALDEVLNILKTEGQKAAHAAYRDIYQDYLQRAKAAGRVQEFWKSPKKLTETQADKHKRVKPTVQIQEQIKKIYRNAGRLS